MHLNLSTFLLGILIFFQTTGGMGQGLDVHLERIGPVNSCIYQSLGDEVVVTTGDSFPLVLARLRPLQQVRLINEGQLVRLSLEGKDLGAFSEVLFWCNDAGSRFNLIFQQLKDDARKYYDHLVVLPGRNSLKLINRTYMENYIKGVVEAEAGNHRTLDFFKVQAVCARTYALSHLGKHAREGFDLCDQTHCQAYRGVMREDPMISEAVKETGGEVIVYHGTQLVEAVFSANCGGITANSEDVWVSKVDYLRSTQDYNHCEGFTNHNWHASFSKPEFFARLGNYLKMEVTHYEVIPDVSGRVRQIVLNGEVGSSISGEEIRRIFNFKSSKFHIFDSGSLFFIEGDGFGHGVGMCQDGAYFLSRTGMDYRQILSHYYLGVEILPQTKLEENRLATHSADLPGQ